jgi:flagellin-specific chaperone FliS
LASKVRSFMAEAKEAARTGDWIRARNAAKKAEVISQELAGSL